MWFKFRENWCPSNILVSWIIVFLFLTYAQCQRGIWIYPLKWKCLKFEQSIQLRETEFPLKYAICTSIFKLTKLGKFWFRFRYPINSQLEPSFSHDHVSRFFYLHPPSLLKTPQFPTTFLFPNQKTMSYHHHLRYRGSWSSFGCVKRQKSPWGGFFFIFQGYNRGCSRHWYPHRTCHQCCNCSRIWSFCCHQIAHHWSWLLAC